MRNSRGRRRRRRGGVDDEETWCCCVDGRCDERICLQPTISTTIHDKDKIIRKRKTKLFLLFSGLNPLSIEGRKILVKSRDKGRNSLNKKEG